MNGLDDRAMPVYTWNYEHQCWAINLSRTYKALQYPTFLDSVPATFLMAEALKPFATCLRW